MAESQAHFVYDAQTLAGLDATLSASRLKSYLKATNQDREMAIKMYLWNARMAKAFLFPLQVAEVTTRNAIHSSLSRLFGSN